MFCYVCGTKIPDDTNFCPACGAETVQGRALSRHNPPNTVRRNSFSVPSILIVVVSVAMIMAMLSLPLVHFIMKKDHIYTVSLNGENYMAYNDEQIVDELKTFVILIITCVAAVNAFSIAQKYGLAAISTMVNLWLIFILEGRLSTLWHSELKSYSYIEKTHKFADGMIICTIGAFALFVLTVTAYKIQRYNKAKEVRCDPEKE